MHQTKSGPAKAYLPTFLPAAQEKWETYCEVPEYFLIEECILEFVNICSKKVVTKNCVQDVYNYIGMVGSSTWRRKPLFGELWTCVRMQISVVYSKGLQNSRIFFQTDDSKENPPRSDLLLGQVTSASSASDAFHIHIIFYWLLL